MTELRLRYQTVEIGDIDIHLCTLRDNQEFYDPEGIAEALGISSATWPLFGVIWPSSLVLAHYIADYVADQDFSGKRILEVGCGMALSSLLLNKLGVDVTATDYHPEAKKFLQRSALLNSDRDIPFEQLDWTKTTKQNTPIGEFDVVIGSDILYEDSHSGDLASFIECHAKPSCEVIIVDPGRGRKNKLSLHLANYGFSVSQEKPKLTDFLEKEFKGSILKYVRPSH